MIQYVAPIECPTAQEVARRLPVDSTARFQIEKSARGYRGTIALDDNSFVREAEEPSCKGVVDALLLVVAPSFPEADHDANETALLAKLGDDTPSHEEAKPPNALAISVGGSLFFLGNGNLRLPGLQPFVEIAPHFSGWYAPSARLAIGRTLDAHTDPDGFAVTLTQGALTACPLGVHTSASILLAACVEFSGGVVDVGASDSVVHGRWMGASPLARIRFESATWFFEAGAGAFIPVAPDHFSYRNVAFDPGAMVLLTAGVGYTFR